MATVWFVDASQDDLKVQVLRGVSPDATLFGQICW